MPGSSLKVLREDGSLWLQYSSASKSVPEMWFMSGWGASAEWNVASCAMEIADDHYEPYSWQNWGSKFHQWWDKVREFNGLGTWTSCADETKSCHFTGTRVVRYQGFWTGHQNWKGSTINGYVDKTMSGPVLCKHGGGRFDPDPTLGLPKKCFLRPSSGNWVERPCHFADVSKCTFF